MSFRRDITAMAPHTLNRALTYFLFEARKVDGSLYPSLMMHGLYAALQNGLKAKGSPLNLFSDKEFEDARKCLGAVMKKRASEGLGLEDY